MVFQAKGALNGIIAKNLYLNRLFSIIAPLFMKVNNNQLKEGAKWQRWFAKAICQKKSVRLASALMHGEKNGPVIGIISAIVLSAANQMPNARNNTSAYVISFLRSSRLSASSGSLSHLMA